jgi:uncharacterized SAM-binding protein YcdF (DUF218 family)
MSRPGKFLFETLVLPPGGPLLLLLSALLWQHRPKLQTVLLVLGIGLLYISSIPATTALLRSQLERFSPIDLRHADAQAIVVIGADRYREAPEYGRDTATRFGLERIRYAAWLQKRIHLPMLVSGGGEDEKVPEAHIMRDVLKEDFGATVDWIEDTSRNTHENAVHSSELLRKHGIQRIILVTHAWHMPRALQAFRTSGLTVVPAPTQFYRPGPYEKGVYAWFPGAGALLWNQLALHEIVGYWWYRIRYH